MRARRSTADGGRRRPPAPPTPSEFDAGSAEALVWDALRAGGAGSDAGGAAANAVEAGAPLADERASYVGASEGDVSLFREGGGALAAFRWATGGWERVGPVVAATRRAATRRCPRRHRAARRRGRRWCAGALSLIHI